METEEHHQKLDLTGMEGAGKLPRVDPRIYSGVASRKATSSLKPFPDSDGNVIDMPAYSARTTLDLPMVADSANLHSSCCLAFDNNLGSSDRYSLPCEP